MSTQILLALGIATIASSLYRMLSEEVPRMMAAIVAIVCFLICLVLAPFPVQLLIFFGLLSIYRHQPAV
jgi:chromate transport protein ChrA